MGLPGPGLGGRENAATERIGEQLRTSSPSVCCRTAPTHDQQTIGRLTRSAHNKKVEICHTGSRGPSDTQTHDWPQKRAGEVARANKQTTARARPVVPTLRPARGHEQNSDRGHTAPLRRSTRQASRAHGRAHGPPQCHLLRWLLRVLCSFLLLFLRHCLTVPARENDMRGRRANVAGKQVPPRRQTQASMREADAQRHRYPEAIPPVSPVHPVSRQPTKQLSRVRAKLQPGAPGRRRRNWQRKVKPSQAVATIPKRTWTGTPSTAQCTCQTQECSSPKGCRPR